MGVSVLPVTTASWVVKSVYLCAVYVLTPIFSFIFCYNNSCGSSMPSIILYESTLPHQHCLSPDMKQGINLRRPTELCYINELVDINIVYHITLSKAKSMWCITLLWARHKHQLSLSHYFKQDKYQCGQYCESLRCLKSNNFVPNCV